MLENQLILNSDCTDDFESNHVALGIESSRHLMICIEDPIYSNTQEQSSTVGTGFSVDFFKCFGIGGLWRPRTTLGLYGCTSTRPDDSSIHTQPPKHRTAASKT